MMEDLLLSQQLLGEMFCFVVIISFLMKALYTKQCISGYMYLV